MAPILLLFFSAQMPVGCLHPMALRLLVCLSCLEPRLGSTRIRVGHEIWMHNQTPCKIFS